MLTLMITRNHAALMYFSDHGTPIGWRNQHGYGCHTFKWYPLSSSSPPCAHKSNNGMQGKQRWHIRLYKIPLPSRQRPETIHRRRSPPIRRPRPRLLKARPLASNRERRVGILDGTCADYEAGGGGSAEIGVRSV